MSGITKDFDIIIPTPTQEHYLGFDAGLRTLVKPVYYQFKAMVPRVARSPKDARQHRWKPPWLEFKIRSRNQHNLMYELSQRFVSVYAAPLLVDTREMLTCALHGKLKANSIEIDPSFAGPIVDDDEHRYLIKGKSVLFCSDPREGTVRSQTGIEYAASDAQAVTIADVIETTLDVLEVIQSNRLAPSDSNFENSLRLILTSLHRCNIELYILVP